MPVLSFRLAVRVASLGKLLSTISTFPGSLGLAPSKVHQSVTLVVLELLYFALCQINLNQELFIWKNREEKCMFLSLYCLHTPSKLSNLYFHDFSVSSQKVSINPLTAQHWSRSGLELSVSKTLCTLEKYLCI